MLQSLRTVGITGMGIISSIGDDVPSFTASLRRGVTGIKRSMRTREPLVSAIIAAELDNFSFVDSLNRLIDISDETRHHAKRLGQRAPFPVQLSILSALEAWGSARLFGEAPAPERIGVIVAGQNSTSAYQYDVMSKFREDPEYLSPRYALEFLESNQAGVLSELFGIEGEGCTIGGASATGNVGIIKGYHSILTGLLDVCLVAGVAADPSPMDIQGFVNIGAMGGKEFRDRPDKACRPFDARHEGFIYGQAGACIILESEPSASARGVPLQAVVKGGAINLDGNSSADPSVRGEMKAMLSALAGSGLSPSGVDYLNTHGSSSPLGDATEAEAIYRVFGKHASDLWVNATKGLTGHCLWSAGVVEIIATVAQMREGFLHPNKNLEEPVRADVRFCGAGAMERRINTAMSNSFGFGGINTSVVVTRGTV